MMGLSLSRRARIGLLVVFIIGLIVFFPMRLAAGMLGLDRMGVSARAIQGSIWYGGIGQLIVGEVSLGTVNAGISPLQLFVGRVRLDIWRKTGAPDDIEGALTSGIGRIGLDDVTGTVPLGAALAPLPVSGVDFTDVSAYFSGGACGHAEGRVKARIAGELPGVNLSQGLTGDVRCEGAMLLVPLVSQSGLEKLTLRIGADGRYTADMRIASSDPALAQGLQAAGFAPAGDGYVLKVNGSL